MGEAERKQLLGRVAIAEVRENESQQTAAREIALVKKETTQALDVCRAEMAQERERAEAKRKEDIAHFAAEVKKLEEYLEKERLAANTEIARLQKRCDELQREADDRVRAAYAERDAAVAEARRNADKVAKEAEMEMQRAAQFVRDNEARSKKEILKAREAAEFYRGQNAALYHVEPGIKTQQALAALSQGRCLNDASLVHLTCVMRRQIVF